MSDALKPMIQDMAESAFGCVSRVSPVQTALRNCMRDEGGPFGFGDQELIPSYRKLLWSKGHPFDRSILHNGRYHS